MTLYRTIYSQKKSEFCKAHSKEILDMVHADPRYIEYKANKKAEAKKEIATEKKEEKKDSPKIVKSSLIN